MFASINCQIEVNYESMMSEKGRGMEMEDDDRLLRHLIHEHPLSLIENGEGEGNLCKGCARYITEEAGYGCKKCGNEKLIHQECAEMPREIRHPMHPQHTLLQQKGDGSRRCVVCEWTINRIGYFCSSCEFQLHLKCAPAGGVKRVADQQTGMVHPSHPEHRLVLLRRKLSSKCDACGLMETGRSYVCVDCQYLINEDCATLPLTADYHHLHHHTLSLAFYLPAEYIKFLYLCDVCRKEFQLHRWVYHCQICNYVVHIKCATTMPTFTASNEYAKAEGFIQFPVGDVCEELIKPFVIKERGQLMILDEGHNYWFPNHHHQLSLVSSKINNNDDDGSLASELTCDACTTPIFQYESHYKYMSCSTCKYFLHLVCFHLPQELPCHPLHEEEGGHRLVLKSCPNPLFLICHICEFPTNGLFYDCTKCNFKADIKCLSLPNTVKHEAHPHHLLHSKSIPMKRSLEEARKDLCCGCGGIVFCGMLYKCGSCKFVICRRCALLPPVNEHNFEKHPLPLRYDANLNHLGDFYCDGCERLMNPKEWMYDCRQCDTSFHPACIHATSGYYQNLKFGDQYAVPAALHPHPLTFQLLTTKLRCDVCGLRIYGESVVDQGGLHCSACNFFMCAHRCAQLRLNDILPIH